MPPNNKYAPNRKVSAEEIILLLNRLQAGGLSDDSLKIGRYNPNSVEDLMEKATQGKFSIGLSEKAPDDEPDVRKSQWGRSLLGLTAISDDNIDITLTPQGFGTIENIFGHELIHAFNPYERHRQHNVKEFDKKTDYLLKTLRKSFTDEKKYREYIAGLMGSYGSAKPTKKGKYSNFKHPGTTEKDLKARNLDSYEPGFGEGVGATLLGIPLVIGGALSAPSGEVNPKYSAAALGGGYALLKLADELYDRGLKKHKRKQVEKGLSEIDKFIEGN